ncbi:NAD binding domain of 6-phosphogluconate dehydrogenase-domain-containing protein [Boeremia exigua]|uniref:NAD binding domain of 6-phosphogluconate dehydrogenase-domain-containing protein n=1 Tax=Boeremia exigua TaxID=749465 RepID=UPI001E8E71F7|nr:NAD binding domain of 6-phosphogluconate dehydrogenase-domain-containing protein [Boeremia exigua]KAH6615396.1 NAD binding domain of 6-phosphogluconate dehydrogenase-domain-containing protein [Boeremia exigua]
MVSQIAWIGLGNMGRARNLQKPLIIYNRTKERSEDLASTLGWDRTRVLNTVNSVVNEADIIFLCLGDDASVVSIVDIILQEDVEGKLIIDCSSLHPDTTNGLEKRITAQGAEFVGMPVFGPPAMAESGQLVCVLAGKSSSCSRVKPYIKGVMGRAEMIGNTFILNIVNQLSEGYVLAEKSGLGVDNLHNFVGAVLPGLYIEYSQRMLQGSYHKRTEPLFHVDLARKDARHAMSLGESSGAQGSLKLLKVVRGRLDVVKAELGDRGDISSVYGAVRNEAGLDFRNKE